MTWCAIDCTIVCSNTSKIYDIHQRRLTNFKKLDDIPDFLTFLIAIHWKWNFHWVYNCAYFYYKQALEHLLSPHWANMACYNLKLLFSRTQLKVVKWVAKDDNKNVKDIFDPLEFCWLIIEKYLVKFFYNIDSVLKKRMLCTT